MSSVYHDYRYQGHVNDFHLRYKCKGLSTQALNTQQGAFNDKMETREQGDKEREERFHTKKDNIILLTRHYYSLQRRDNISLIQRSH